MGSRKDSSGLSKCVCPLRPSAEEEFVGGNLSSCMARSEDRWCILGDFNSIRSEGERKGAVSHCRYEEIKCFEEFILEAKLIDLPMVGRKFMWYRSDGSAMSRLDRFLVSE